MDEIREKLFSMKDEEYRLFTGRSIPNVKIDNIIGVRIPDIRKMAKEIKDEEVINNFLDNLPHKYHEENLLHGVFLGTKIKDIDVLLKRLDEFLKYVDNWAVCDTIGPKIFKKYPDKVY